MGFAIMLLSKLALSGAIAICMAGPALSAPVECNFDSWKGADSDDIVISWVGLGFIADASKGVVEVRVRDGYYPVQKAEVIKSERFTGFVYYIQQEASDGSTYRNRYSFRLYNTGRCEARIDKSGYYPLIATGNVE